MVKLGGGGLLAKFQAEILSCPIPYHVNQICKPLLSLVYDDITLHKHILNLSATP